MELDLEEAVFGVTREIHVPGLVDCEACDGTGSTDRKLKTCGTCRGHGRVRMQNGIFSIQQTCPTCGGRGQVPSDPCRACHGSGCVEKDRNLEVRIPAGVDNGDRIRLAGEGESGNRGTPPGDLYIDVHVRPHAIFERNGDDLHCEIPIRFSQAALGAEIVVPTLEGEAQIRIPAETQTGRQFRLRGKGVKSVRSRSTGDLLCRVVVETPVNLSAQQRELLEAFEATFDDGGRAHQPRQSSWFDGVRQFWDRVTS
jgi:molecular chaperone DnaJ